MAEEKKVVPKHIKSFYDKSEKLEKLLESTNIAHSKAYHTALEVIKGSDGLYDHGKLKDTKVQDNFLDKMIGSYMSFAMDRLGIKEKPKDEFEQDIIMQKYIGVTKSQLKKHLRKTKDGYKLQVHEKIRDGLVEEQKKQLTPLRHSHLDMDHLDDILKHTKTSKYINKDVIQDIGEAVNLLDLYKRDGSVDKKSVKDYGLDNLLTKGAKDELKAMKDNYKKAA